MKTNAPSNRLWVARAGVGLLIAAISVWHWKGSAESVVGALPSTAPHTETSTVGPCELAPGQRGSWVLSSKTEVSIDAEKLGASPGQPLPAGVQTFRGTLDVEVLHRDETGAAVVLAHVRDALNGEVPSASFEQPFLIRVASNCSITGFARSTKTDQALARDQQALIHELWWVLPADERSNVQGTNGTGAFEAIVARGQDAEGTFAQRRVSHYTQGWSREGRTLTVKDSLLTVRFGRGVWFDEAEGDESISGGALSSGRSVFSAHSREADASALTTFSHWESQYEWGNWLPRTFSAPLPAAAAFTPEEVKENAVLARTTLDDALRTFEGQVAREPNIAAQWQHMARYLEARPEMIPVYATGIQHPDFPSDMKAVAFMALGGARVPEARDALLTIRASRTAFPYDRIRCNLALVGRSDVGIELAQTLRKASQALMTEPSTSPDGLYARNALLSLGMMAGLRAGRDAPIELEAKAAVTEALQKAPRTTKHLSPVFGAMGNLGDPTILTVLEPWAHEPDVDLRALAPRALRRLKQADVAQYELAWLARETAPDVKEELYNVIHHQLLDEHLDASEALALQAVKDLRAQPLILTRQSLVRILGPVAHTYPPVRLVLMQQVRLELGSGSGLFDLLSQYLTADEVSHGLHDGELAQPPPTVAISPTPGTAVEVAP